MPRRKSLTSISLTENAIEESRVLLQPSRNVLKNKLATKRNAGSGRQRKVVQGNNREGHLQPVYRLKRAAKKPRAHPVREGTGRLPGKTTAF